MPHPSALPDFASIAWATFTAVPQNSTFF